DQTAVGPVWSRPRPLSPYFLSKACASLGHTVTSLPSTRRCVHAFAERRNEMADNDFAEFKSALIVGAGAGLSAALARVLTRAGLKVTLASRTIDDLAALQRETGAQAFACDATKEAEVG